jgi:hypothetical protein
MTYSGIENDGQYMTSSEMEQHYMTSAEMDEQYMTSADMLTIDAITNQVMDRLITDGYTTGFVRAVGRGVKHVAKHVKGGVVAAVRRTGDVVDNAEERVGRGMHKVYKRSSAAGKALSGNDEGTIARRAQASVDRDAQAEIDSHADIDRQIRHHNTQINDLRRSKSTHSRPEHYIEV